MQLSRLFLILPVLAVAACGEQGFFKAPFKPQTATTAGGTTVTATETPTGDAVVIATPPGTGSSAAPAPAGAAKLGTTVASLGDAGQKGLWIKTPLTKAPGKGRLVNPATGKSTNVDLIPLAGAPSGGSQVSLPALQALGASLTDLPTIEVWRS